jgi:purine-binding chemotaxis protein CheW
MHSEADVDQTIEPASGGDERQLVIFQMGAELYGVDISRVHEIIRLQAITRVPRAPSFVEGVINLRGKVIPVVDLRRRFGLPMADHTRASRIVVVEVGDQVVGIIVDGVSEVLRVNTATIEPPSPVVAGIDSEYLQGIAKLPERLVILLDLERAIDVSQSEQSRHGPCRGAERTGEIGSSS